jgi:XTP/dITP diphosphohydrolase
MRLIFATHNLGKVKEIKDILSGLNIEILSAEDVGVFEDAVEDGQTFEENAFKKAKFVVEKTDEWAVADDSGICIRALNGAPGINSARWAGDRETVDPAEYTLSKMLDVPEKKRDAWFKSAAVLYAPDGRYWIFRGIVEGTVSKERRGIPRPRLPYDTIFMPTGHNRTFAEMSDAEKNSLSHRGLAFRQLREFVEKIIMVH